MTGRGLAPTRQGVFRVDHRRKVDGTRVTTLSSVSRRAMGGRLSTTLGVLHRRLQGCGCLFTLFVWRGLEDLLSFPGTTLKIPSDFDT